jgi:hypothetical protein
MNTVDNLVGLAVIELEILRIEFDVHQNRMRIIEIDDLETVFRKRDRRVGKRFL